jgi:hypothetical protein
MKIPFIVVLLMTVSMLAVSQTKNRYTWKGRPIDYAAWRDSLRIEYLKYCDSLKTKKIMQGNSMAKKYKIRLKWAQQFEHDIMTTNQAIFENKILYTVCGTTKSSYVFDLKNMRLYRDMDGVKDEFEIVNILDDRTLFSVYVKFSDEQYAYYIYQDEDDGTRTLFCRWIENNKISGWFSSGL